MSHPLLLLIAANLAKAGFLIWKWSLWPVLTWLAVQRKKSTFSLTLYNIINGTKHFQTVFITPQPCHSHCCCWLLLVWPKLDFWSENVAYDLCWLCWQYNRANLYFFWLYMIFSMIWNTSKLSASHLSRATAIVVVDCCQFGPSWIYGLKTVQECFISLILTYKARKNIASLCCIANQVGTGHKLHF